MRRAIRYLGYAAAGLAFWIPSILLHAIRKHDFGGSRLDSIAILVLPAVSSFLVLAFLCHKDQGLSRRGTIRLWMLLGIWMLGPLCMTLGATFTGGGFSQPHAWPMLLLGIPLFVPLTFMMSAYDGTLLTLAGVTIWFILASVFSFVRRRVAQPVTPKPDS